jgi:hypothetical protein
VTDIAPAQSDFAGLPPWMQTMRQAAMDSIKEEDVKQIVANQVKAAKEGDGKAIRFVFDYLLGGNAMKGATFIQNNFHGEQPQTPTDERPGSNGKLSKMQKRLAANLPLTNKDDGPEVDLS